MVVDVDVAAAALELYGLPPEDFTAARNQAAKQANDAGDHTAGVALKALRKPTLAAWLANLLVRTDPAGVDELTKLGENLRAAHGAGDRRRLRELTLQRHGLVRKLVTTARTHARAQGHTVSTPTEQRLTETLDAAVIDPSAAQLLRTGQLTSALRHVGFGVVDETGDPAHLPPIQPRIVRSAQPKPPRKATTRPGSAIQLRRLGQLRRRRRDRVGGSRPWSRACCQALRTIESLRGSKRHRPRLSRSAGRRSVRASS